MWTPEQMASHARELTALGLEIPASALTTPSDAAAHETQFLVRLLAAATTPAVDGRPGSDGCAR